MVSELGLDAAEAKPKASEQVAMPRTDAVNKTDLKLFMRKPLCSAVESLDRGQSSCQWHLSALLRRTRGRNTFSRHRW